MGVTIKQLTVFVAIAQHENITLAAQEIFLSQPAASMTLTALETQLNILLFDRQGKKLVLNANGAALLPKAVEMIDKVKQIQNMFLLKKEKLSGSLRIGASTTIGNYILPSLITEFKERYPEVTINLKVANTEKIIADLMKFNLDVGFVEGSCHEKKLNVSLWKKDELVVFTSAKNKGGRRKNLKLSDIQIAPWIMREIGSGTRELIEQTIKPKNVILEFSSTEAIKLAVQQGEAVSCLSQATLAQELKDKKLSKLNIENISLMRDFVMLTHTEKYTSPTLNEFIKHTKK
jgi:DNA-binding transcriptional LysR family regulator